VLGPPCHVPQGTPTPTTSHLPTSHVVPRWDSPASVFRRVGNTLSSKKHHKYQSALMRSIYGYIGQAELFFLCSCVWAIRSQLKKSVNTQVQSCEVYVGMYFFLLPDSFLTECSKHTYCYYVHTHNTYDTYSIYFWCGTHMLVWVIICFAFSVLFPVLILVLTLGTSPVLQPNDPLWSNMWGREEGRER